MPDVQTLIPKDKAKTDYQAYETHMTNAENDKNRTKSFLSSLDNSDIVPCVLTVK